MECSCQTAASSNSFRASSCFKANKMSIAIWVWKNEDDVYRMFISNSISIHHGNILKFKLEKKLGETNLTTPSINTSILDGFHHWTNLSELFNVLPTSSLVIIIGHLAGSYEKTQQKQQEQHQFPGRKSGIVDWSVELFWSWAFGWEFSLDAMIRFVFGMRFFFERCLTTVTVGP